MPKVTGQAVVEPGAGPGSLAPVPGCAPNMQLVPVRPAHPHSSGDFGHESAGNSELSVCLAVSVSLCLGPGTRKDKHSLLPKTSGLIQPW